MLKQGNEVILDSVNDVGIIYITIEEVIRQLHLRDRRGVRIGCKNKQGKNRPYSGNDKTYSTLFVRTLGKIHSKAQCSV